MSLPSIIGPVTNGTAFMFASLQDGVPFILNSAAVTGGVQYYWDSDLVNIVQNQRMGIFTTEGPLDNMTIHDSLNNGNIGFEPDGVTITRTTFPVKVKMSQPSYTNWSSPDLFLSSVPYTLYNSAGATAYVRTAVTGTTGNTGTIVPADNLVVLPVKWYFNCIQSGNNITYNAIQDPRSSVVNWFCLANTGTTGCTGIQIAPNGWTNLDDCTVGNQYMYCPVNNVCGDNNCNGPCPSSLNECSFSNGRYACVFDPNKLIGDEWWKSPYFIGAIVAAVLLIIIFIILIYIVGRSK